MSEQVKFRTERLVLRPWKESDAETLFLYARDPEVGPAAGWKPHESVEESREIIRTVLSQPMTWAVCVSERPVGSIGLFPCTQKQVPMGENELEVGYWIGRPYWGQGLIPEAVRALQRYAFETLDCPVLWCAHFDGNEKSRRVQEKCGFVYHHTEENVPTQIPGITHTDRFTRLSREAWLEARRSKPEEFYQVSAF